MSILLSICDFLKSFCFFFIYLSPKIHNYWILGVPICKVLQKLLFGFFSTTASFTVLLTYERFLVIVEPFRGGLAKRKFRFVIVAITLLQIVMFSNNKLFRFEVRGGEESSCQSMSITSRAPWVLGIEISLLSCYMLLSSLAMLYMLYKCTCALLRVEIATSMNIRRRHQNKSTVYIMRSIYIAYVTSLIPWVSLYFLAAFDAPKMIRFETSIWSVPVYWFIAGSFCNAPLTFLYFSQEFRNEVRHLFELRKVMAYSFIYTKGSGTQMSVKI